jgi:hypothetical protein
VVVPLDGMSSASAYFDQYTIVQLSGTLGVTELTTLTRSDMVTFQ